MDQSSTNYRRTNQPHSTNKSIEVNVVNNVLVDGRLVPSPLTFVLHTVCRCDEEKWRGCHSDVRPTTKRKSKEKLPADSILRESLWSRIRTMWFVNRDLRSPSRCVRYERRHSINFGFCMQPYGITQVQISLWRLRTPYGNEIILTSCPMVANICNKHYSLKCEMASGYTFDSRYS